MPSRKSRGLMLFCPDRYCESGVTEIDIGDLKRAGVEAVLLDLDNTLVAWQGRDIPAAVEAWLRDLKAAGFKLYLVSNTRFGKRLRALSAQLDIPYVRRAWKPRRRGFLQAMQALGVEPSKTVMIGDQMFTDILGGNRLGIHTFMVQPMATREFFGTKISRVAERALLAWFRKTGRI